MGEKQKKGIEYEGTVPLETVIGYLDSLKEHLASGEVQVDNGSEEMLLTPADNVKMRVRAREKEGEQSLRFEFAWECQKPKSHANGLRIGAPNGASRKSKSKKK